jgi:hypothetical protein
MIRYRLSAVLSYLQLSRKPAVPDGIVEVQVVEEHAFQALFLFLITDTPKE